MPLGAVGGLAFPFLLPLSSSMPHIADAVDSAPSNEVVGDLGDLAQSLSYPAAVFTGPFFLSWRL